MIKKIAIVFGIFLFANFFLIGGVNARYQITDWYIQDFDSQITVNSDSSLDIVEKITADCGNLSNKHGIFRVLPENINLTNGTKIKTPVKLIAITDFNGSSINYSETRNSSDKTVTWKIGDANKTVQGVNYYKIHYRVENAIRFQDPKFDELYWNLNGNFWDIEIDKFHASIIFPSEVTKDNSVVDYYTGSLGSKDKSQAKYSWSAPNVLQFDSLGTLGARQGITVSVTTAKNIFAQYVPGLLELYGQYLYLLIPISVLAICFFLWWKYGKDPRVDKTVIAEYGAPGNLSPIELGMLLSSGTFKNELITAEIINFATKGVLNIKEAHQKILFFDSKDYEFSKISKPEEEVKFNAAQKIILKAIFRGLDGACLSNLKKTFHTSIPEIKKTATSSLRDKGLITMPGLHMATFFRIISAVFVWLTFVSFGQSILLGSGVFASAVIIFVFSFLMPKRTPAGADLHWQAKGFKLFMETVDKDRAAFYEKENIFEKFLPYAIMFGITGIWIARMKEIYGADYFANHVPLWYAGNVGAFDADSFSATISSLSASIAANTSAPSGSGGAGGSGGGGGGGGGGGW